jgi:shikimate kinase
MALRCVLIGPPGAGKSTVARLLAQRWAVPMIDTDALVVEMSGKRVSEIFIDEGESVFRTWEVAAVKSALEAQEGVVSLGGGAVMTEETAALIASVKVPVVFLDVSISAAAPRIGFNRDRPLLVGNPRASWIALMEKRRPVYEALADHVIPTDDHSPDAVADLVACAVGEQS